ncbi:MAG TPA: filamentous hemagglutinin N-terminal domain-containing protein [Nodularia sp. (in: cyanobacteria)]|nr:filamentous hemagglutinin N-terminal domain-containing protein [Nodularia sp. (in: cyanobacteria)]
MICLLNSGVVKAQIIPDSTLPVNSGITIDSDISIINGGTRAGNNLLHSFDQFSIPNGKTVYFNNAGDIQNIISRVTGKSISNIDGLLRANGAANLFLLNPNGIIFGSNASLNIGGSFLASTASSLKFANGTEFSTTETQIAPLLTVSAPIGLNLENNTGEIRVQGSGHTLGISSLFSPISGAGASDNGLRVLPQKTLALIGGGIALEGGNLTAPGGRVELGSVGNGIVTLNPTTSGWVFGYEGLQNFQNIELSKRALVDASGSGSSAVQLVGKQIFLTEGSVALIQNQGAQTGSGINIQASNLLQLSGTSVDGMIPSGVEIETLGGSVGDVVVSTKRLSFEDGAAINSKTFTQASASNILLNASESIEVKGFSFINPTTSSIASGVGSYTFSAGTSGNIAINTGQLTALDGGTITSGTFGTGTGGELLINAAHSVELSGFNPIFSSPSQVAVGAYKSGNSGNLKIISPEIRLDNGGIIASYTFSGGNAGDITIEAPSFLSITSPANTKDLSYEFLSGISSYAVSPPVLIQQALGLSSEVSGAARSIKITTERLSLSKGSITVSNLGTGSAGNIDIDANIVSLKNNSSISGATALADGGNIFIHANDMQLSDSIISASASNPEAAYRLLGIDFPYNLAPVGAGIGGNVTIDTNTLFSLGNSTITANAFGGRGGNIRINVRDGFLFSENSLVEASSELGINGTVQINGLAINSRGIKAAPEVVQETPKISSGCAAQSGTGTDMLTVASNSPPPNFDEHLDSQPIWQRNFISFESIKHSSELHLSTIKETTKIVEAQSWVIDSRGNVELVATAPNQVTIDSFLSTSSCTSLSSVVEVFPSLATE